MSTSRRIWLVVLLAATPGAAEDGRKRAAEADAEATLEGDTRSGAVTLRSPLSPKVRIHAGEFTMGSTQAEIIEGAALCLKEDPAETCDLPLVYEHFMLDRQALTLEGLFQDELAPHRVTLSPYWIDRREVTVAEYTRCVDVGACTKPPFSEGARRFSKPNLPVSLVTWDDARGYCAWRGARLPTEAEWERAARGVRGRRFPWGNVYNRRVANHGTFDTAWVRDRPSNQVIRFAEITFDDRDGFLESAPVGSFPDGRTPDGIDDMAGNVAEWVSDFFDAHYEPDAVTNPTGPPSSPLRIARGGSFRHPAPYLRGAARIVAGASSRLPWLGFRCVEGG